MMQGPGRIAALDMLRGYALVCIMLDHMPIGVLRRFTLTNFAIFDAAELFVLLSGFLVGMVWIKVQARQGLAAAQWRFLRRAGQVWLALIAGGVLLALLSRVLREAGLVHTAVWFEYGNWVIDNPLGYLGTLGLLWMQPNLLDVLALYVILLALAPVTVPLLLRWPWRFAAGSLALWAVAIPLNAALPNQRVEGGLLFNPFGWQLLFHAGVAMGAFRHRFMPVLRRHARLLTVLAAVVMLYGTLLGWTARWGHAVPPLQPLRDALWWLSGPVDKWRLDAVRVAAIVAASWLVAVPLAGVLGRLAATRLGRALAVIGRGGLVSFVACVLLSVVGDAMAMTPPGAGWPRLLAVDVWVMAALWLVADSWLRLQAGRTQAGRTQAR